MHDGQVEIPGLRRDLGERDGVRRRVDQLAVLDQRRRLRKPGRVPERRDLALRLVSGAGAAVEPVEGGRLKKQGAHRLIALRSRPKTDSWLGHREQRSVAGDRENLSAPPDPR